MSKTTIASAWIFIIALAMGIGALATAPLLFVMAARGAALSGGRLLPSSTGVTGADGSAQAADQAQSDMAAAIALNHRLAASIDLELRHTGVEQVLATIASAAKISIAVQRSVYAMLPFGADTEIDARFHRVSVETALGRLMRELGLSMTLHAGQVTVAPGEELRLIGRRATWGELGLLGRLDQARIANFNGNLRTLLASVHSSVPLKLVLQARPTMADLADAQSVVRTMLPTSVAGALKAYCHSLGLIWYVRHHTIFISSKQAWVKRQLRRPVEFDFHHVPLRQVVSALEQASGVRIIPVAGLYKKAMVINISSSDGSVRQAMDALGAITAVGYQIVGRHVVLAPALAGLAQTNQLVGMVQLPLLGRIKFDLFIRRSQLSAAALGELESKAQRLFKKVAASATSPAVKSSNAR
ncbi:MAG: hypothetical protein HKL96_01340 [Phycisphaerales bacterium]|nr:hypothetical protein [Phycisphaerales bacterium]